MRFACPSAGGRGSASSVCAMRMASTTESTASTGTGSAEAIVNAWASRAAVAVDTICGEQRIRSRGRPRSRSRRSGRLGGPSLYAMEATVEATATYGCRHRHRIKATHGARSHMALPGDSAPVGAVLDDGTLDVIAFDEFQWQVSEPGQEWVGGQLIVLVTSAVDDSRARAAATIDVARFGLAAAQVATSYSEHSRRFSELQGGLWSTQRGVVCLHSGCNHKSRGECLTGTGGRGRKVPRLFLLT